MLKDKKTTLIVSICLLIVVVMLFTLITILVQDFVFKAKIERLKEIIGDREALIALYESEKEYRESWEYIKQKAVELGLLKEDEVRWIEENLPK